jgi:hypothetical protein
VGGAAAALHHLARGGAERQRFGDPRRLGIARLLAVTEREPRDVAVSQKAVLVEGGGVDVITVASSGTHRTVFRRRSTAGFAGDDKVAAPTTLPRGLGRHRQKCAR